MSAVTPSLPFGLFRNLLEIANHPEASEQLQDEDCICRKEHLERLRFGLNVSDDELRAKLQCDKEISKRVAESLISANIRQ